MFIDTIQIKVQAGNGGNGCSSFRREANRPHGGPNGGNGGDGGDVVLLADHNLTTLLDLTYRPMWKAESGEHGMGKDMHGANGADAIVRLPVGTVVKAAGSDLVLCDLVRDGQTFVAAQGGRGGRGNMSFKSATNRAPREAEKGVKAEEIALDLELKLIADVGLVGLPNAGKSTLLNRVSNARSKVAGYPFTTRTPVLGVSRLTAEQSCVLADIPGLIEGAHANVGLGHEFLRHIERTRVLVYVLDAAGTEDRDPVKDLETLQRELSLYPVDLSKRPYVIAANKTDLPRGQGAMKRLQKKAKADGVKIFGVSAATGKGVAALLKNLSGIVQKEAA